MSEFPPGSGGSGGKGGERSPGQQRRRQNEAARVAALLRRRPIVPVGQDAGGPETSSASPVVLYRGDLGGLVTSPPGGTQIIPYWNQDTNELTWWLV